MTGRRLLAAVVAGGLAAAVPAAANAGERGHLGRCRFSATGEATGEQQRVLLAAAVVVFSRTDPADPASATVRCAYTVNGVPWATATFSGSVLVAGQQDVWVQIPSPEDVVAFCTRVEHDNGEVEESCEEEKTIRVPPDEVWGPVDAALCPLLAATAPGVPGVVDVNAEGDVFVAGQPLWDCPPFGGPAPSPPDRAHRGRCGFASWVNNTSSDTHAGLVYAAVAVYAPADPAANPVSATVRCTLTVNGNPVRQAVFTGTGVVAGAEPLFYTATGADAVVLCTRVEFDNGNAEETCPPPTTVEISLDPVWAVVDPALCPALATAAPGVPGAVDVTPQGDVAVAGQPVWNCPPFDD